MIEIVVAACVLAALLGYGAVLFVMRRRMRLDLEELGRWMKDDLEGFGRKLDAAVATLSSVTNELHRRSSHIAKVAASAESQVKGLEELRAEWTAARDSHKTGTPKWHAYNNRVNSL